MSAFTDAVQANAAYTEKLRHKLIREQARKRHYRDALSRIVEFPTNEKRSAGWHFAEVRLIAREALNLPSISPPGAEPDRAERTE